MNLNHREEFLHFHQIFAECYHQNKFSWLIQSIELPRTSDSLWLVFVGLSRFFLYQRLMKFYMIRKDFTGFSGCNGFFLTNCDLIFD